MAKRNDARGAGFGLDAEIAAKLDAKYDRGLEAEILAWIGKVTGKKVSSIEELRDGVILCELINSISAGSIKRINNSTMPFKQMENITAFLVACRGAGVKSHDLFETVDLFDGKDYGLVVQSIFSYASVVTNAPGYKGPTLGVKVASSNEREFSAEQLAKAKNAVPKTSAGPAIDFGKDTTHREIGFGKKYAGDSSSSDVPKTSAGRAMDFGEGTTHREIGFGNKYAGDSGNSAVPKTSVGRFVEGPASSTRDIKFGANSSGVSTSGDVPKTSTGKFVEGPASSSRDIVKPTGYRRA